jgi:membrane protein
LLRECGEDRVSGLSAEIAFYGILSLFPALLAVAGLLGVLQGVTGGNVADRAEDEVVGFLERMLTDDADGTVEAVRQLFAETRPGILTFGAIAAIWAMSRGFAALIRALDIAYDVEESRSWLRVRVVGLVLGLGTLLVVVLLLGMVVLGPLLGTGEDVAESLGAGSAFATAWDWFRLPLIALALLAWGTTLFHYGPASHRTPWRWEIPGALTTAVLAGMSSVGLRLYLTSAAGGNQVFGVLGGALVVLLWMYLMGASLLVGAEVNSMLADRWIPASEDGASAGVEGGAHPADEVAEIGDLAAVEEQAHDR